MEVVPKALAQEEARLAWLSSGRSDHLSRARPTQPIVRGARALQQVQEVECHAWRGPIRPSNQAAQPPRRHGGTKSRAKTQQQEERTSKSRREACMRDKDLGAQPAKLSAPVPHIVAYLGSNAPQTRENVSHSEAVVGVEATKGSK